MTHTEETFQKAERYLQGYGVEKDRNFAIALFRKAAEEGYQPAIERLRELNQPYDDTTGLTNHVEESQIDPNEIAELFKARITAIETLARKINEVQERCAQAEKEVRYAKDCDFKGIFFDDQTKAIEYLQDACVALSNSQISTQEALDLFFQYQIIVSEMINRLISACCNNYQSMEILHKEIDRYLKAQNMRNDAMDQVVQPLLIDLQTRLQQDSTRLKEISLMRSQVQQQAQQLKAISDKKSGVHYENKSKSGGNGMAIAVGIVALLFGVAAILGVRL